MIIFLLSPSVLHSTITYRVQLRNWFFAGDFLQSQRGGSLGQSHPTYKACFRQLLLSARATASFAPTLFRPLIQTIGSSALMATWRAAVYSRDRIRTAHGISARFRLGISYASVAVRDVSCFRPGWQVATKLTAKRPTNQGCAPCVRR